MTELDLSVLKYYKNGNEFCGFEPNSPWKNLCKMGLLDGDLEITRKGMDFIKSYKDWDNVKEFENKTKVSIC